MLDNQYLTVINNFFHYFTPNKDKYRLPERSKDTDMTPETKEGSQKEFDFSSDIEEIIIKKINQLINNFSADSESIFQEVFDYFIEKFLEIKLEEKQNMIFSFDIIYISFNLSKTRLKKDNQVYSPLKILPKTIERVNKYLIENRISKNWISVPNWIAIYKDIASKEENFMLIQNIRKMILLIKFFEFWQNNLKQMVGT